MKHDQLIEDFKQYLMRQGKSGHTVTNATRAARRFLAHIGNQRLDRVSEEQARAFFAGIQGTPKTRQTCGMYVSEFLKFALARLPVRANPRGDDSPRLPGISARKELALRQAWEIQRSADQQEADEQIVARLARQLINFYVHCKRRLKGAPDDVDELYRFAAECEELIQANLPLFMELSAKGLNVHALVNERMQR